MTRRRRHAHEDHIGEREVTIMTAEEKKSHRGHQMIMMRLSIEGWMGYLIREYLVFSEHGFWKIEKFLAAIGKEVTDGEQLTARDLIKCTGRALIEVSFDPEQPRKKEYYVAKWIPSTTQ